MEEDLHAVASTQYDEWIGTVAADSVDFATMEQLLGIDQKAWHLVVVDVFVYGGDQTIVAYGVPTGGNLPAGLQSQVEATGVVEVTRLLEVSEPLHGHVDTNPPPAPALPIRWASELFVFGFKRLHIRMQWRPQDIAFTEYAIHEVGSIVPSED